MKFRLELQMEDGNLEYRQSGSNQYRLLAPGEKSSGGYEFFKRVKKELYTIDTGTRGFTFSSTLMTVSGVDISARSVTLTSENPDAEIAFPPAQSPVQPRHEDWQSNGLTSSAAMRELERRHYQEMERRRAEHLYSQELERRVRNELIFGSAQHIVPISGWDEGENND